MNARWLVVVAILIAGACAGDDDASEDRADDGTGCDAADSLIGGGLAGPGQFPATAGLLVAVAVDANGDQDGASAEPDHLTCTMTKIGPRAFLLAAHCFFENGAQDGTKPVRGELATGARIRILHGVFQPGATIPDGHPESTLTDATVVDQRIHPSWFDEVSAELADDGKLIATDGDAAILVVDVDTPHIAIASIDMDPVGRCAAVVMNGYGCTFFDFGAQTDQLRSLDAQVEDVVGSMLFISSTLTQDPEQGGICPGDSGGALYAGGEDNLVIVGINSRFVSGAVLGVPISPNGSYFTRVDEGPAEMASWLREQLAELAIPSGS